MDIVKQLFAMCFYSLFYPSGLQFDKLISSEYLLFVCVCAVERNEIAIEFRAILNTNRISNYTLRKQTIPIYGPSYICAKIEERGKYCCVNSGGFSGRLGAVRSVCAPLHTINMIFELSGTSRN